MITGGEPIAENPCKSGFLEGCDVHLAQTSDHLSVSWAAGGSHLFSRSGLCSRGRRQLDHTRFLGAYLLDLHHVASHPPHLSSIAVLSFPNSGALRIHLWSMVLSVILLVAGFVFYGKLLRAQAVSSRPTNFDGDTLYRRRKADCVSET